MMLGLKGDYEGVTLLGMFYINLYFSFLLLDALKI